MQNDFKELGKSTVSCVSSITIKIYTSMHQLREFFETEKEYVSDIRQIIEKKLVSQKAVGSLGKGSYINVVTARVKWGQRLFDNNRLAFTLKSVIKVEGLRTVHNCMTSFIDDPLNIFIEKFVVF